MRYLAMVLLVMLAACGSQGDQDLPTKRWVHPSTPAVTLPDQSLPGVTP